MTVVLAHPACRGHDPGPHVEAPERLQAIETTLEDAGMDLWAAEPATRTDLLRVHTERHVNAMARLAERNAHVHLDPDTVFAGQATWDAAVAGTGLTQAAASHALEGRPAFALPRPPGHHATPDGAMGFCIFNHVALAAAWALEKAGARRVAIVDVDVHHGNGTQDAFYHRSDVLYVSLHQAPLYPGTGALRETGTGDGRGFTVNVPLPAGLSDGPYAHLVERVVIPVVEAYAPDLLLVSAGYDAHARDPLGGLRLSTGFYGALFARLRRVTERVAAVLEGGYDPEALAASVLASVQGLSGSAPDARWEAFLQTDEAPAGLLGDVTRAHGEAWPVPRPAG